MFDPNIDNNGGVKFKEDGLIEIIEDYNDRYEQDFTIPDHAKFKKDIAARLAHKEPYSPGQTAYLARTNLLVLSAITDFHTPWNKISIKR